MAKKKQKARIIQSSPRPIGTAPRCPDTPIDIYIPGLGWSIGNVWDESRAHWSEIPHHEKPTLWLPQDARDAKDWA